YAMHRVCWLLPRSGKGAGEWAAGATQARPPAAAAPRPPPGLTRGPGSTLTRRWQPAVRRCRLPAGRWCPPVRAARRLTGAGGRRRPRPDVLVMAADSDQEALTGDARRLM